MKKKYMIGVPDKKNPGLIKYFYVKGPKFLYGDKIVTEKTDIEQSKKKKNKKERKINKARAEMLVKKSKNNTRRTMDTVENQGLERKSSFGASIEKKNLSENENLSEKSLAARIAREISKIMDEDENDADVQDVFENETYEREEQKRNISGTQKIEYVRRFTVPKERGLLSRIINRMKYENNWYEDIEMYLDNNYYAYNEIEASRIASKSRDQRLYKRVQAYEDAEDDVAMKKAFLSVKVGAAVAMLATLGFSVNLLYNEVHDLIHNSSYIAQAQEKSTLANANEGEIAHAERVLAKIDYTFEHLTYNELLDTVIRVGGKTSEITESRAMGTIKNAGDFADQKLLEEIIQDAYEDEYSSFDDKKKQELNQLVYEMLDDEIKIWIRSPEDVAKLKEKKGMYTLGTDEVGSER